MTQNSRRKFYLMGLSILNILAIILLIINARAGVASRPRLMWTLECLAISILFDVCLPNVLQKLDQKAAAVYLVGGGVFGEIVLLLFSII